MKRLSLTLAAIAAGVLACSFQVALDDGTYPPCQPDGSCLREGCVCLDGRVCVPVALGGMPEDCRFCRTDEECRVDGPCIQGVCGEDGRCTTVPINVPCDDNLDCTVDDWCQDGVCTGQPVDGDSDGYPPIPCGADCNDSRADINPGFIEDLSLPETCADGDDNDCDFLVDGADDGCGSTGTCTLGDGSVSVLRIVDYADLQEIPRGLALGLLDDDGFPDILILVEDPDGPDHLDLARSIIPADLYVFDTPALFEAEGPVDLALGDFNWDGIPDVAALLANPAQIEVFLGSRDPIDHYTLAFQEVIDLYNQNQPVLAMVAADVDQDGIQDLLVTRGGDFDDVVILRGNGDPWPDGMFGQPIFVGLSCPEPTGLIAKDLDLDAIVDLALACPDTGEVHVLPGNGTDGVWGGGFLPDISIVAPCPAPTWLAAGDFDEDGLPDLAVACQGYDSDDLAVADLDADSRLDLAGVNSTDVVVALGGGANGRGNGSLSQPSSFALPSPPSAVRSRLAVGDLDLDAIPDLVISRSNGIYAALGQGQGSHPDGSLAFDEARSTTIGEPLPFLLSWDLDADGAEDVVLGEVVDGDSFLTYYLQGAQDGRGTGSVETIQTLMLVMSPGSILDAVSGDLDGDQVPDLAALFTTASTTLAQILTADAPAGLPDLTFRAGQTLTLTQGTSLALADFNRDAILDLVVSSLADKRIFIYPGIGSNGRGSGSFVEVAVHVSLVYDATAYAIADFNRDGFLDVLLATTEPGFRLYLGGYQGDWKSFDSSFGWTTGACNATRMRVADRNQDGWPDVLVACPDGARLLTKVPRDVNLFETDRLLDGRNIVDLAVAELNGDGLPDVLALASGDAAIIPLFGQPDGTLIEGTPLVLTVTDCGSPTVMAASDFLTDGMTDAAVICAGRPSLVLLTGLGTCE